MIATRMIPTSLATCLLVVGTLTTGKSDVDVMPFGEVLSHLSNAQYLSSLKQAELLVGPKSQRLTVRPEAAAFVISAITCDAAVQTGYTAAMGVMKSNKGVQFQMSKVGPCVMYRLFGGGLDTEVMQLAVFVFGGRVYGLKKDTPISVKMKSR